jgi:hypothetical protein
MMRHDRTSHHGPRGRLIGHWVFPKTGYFRIHGVLWSPRTGRILCTILTGTFDSSYA